MASTWIDPVTFEMPPPMTTTPIPDPFDGFWSTSSFEEDAIARALQVSFSSHGGGGDDPTTSSSCVASSPPTPLPIRHVGAGRTPAVAAPTGRVGKRKRRPSKRAPVTYIEADPANFREMVQMITGVQVAEATGDRTAEPLKVKRPTATSAAAAPVELLPTLDTSAFLLDRAAAEVAMGEAVKEEALEAFPTLDSWGSFEDLEF